MSLSCQFTVGTPAYVDGQFVPIETLTLTVLNPGTTAVSVTGVDLQFSDRSLAPPPRPPLSPPLPPVTQGQQLLIQPGATATFGPFPLAIWTTAKLALAGLITPSQPAGAIPGVPVFVGGIVYGSDGTANMAGAARILLSAPSSTPRSVLGGVADFAASDCASLIPVVA